MFLEIELRQLRKNIKQDIKVHYEKYKILKIPSLLR
jgi:hypothetical protein